MFILSCLSNKKLQTEFNTAVECLIQGIVQRAALDNCIVPQVGISVGSQVGVNVIKPNRSLSGAIRNPLLHTHSHMHDRMRRMKKDYSDEHKHAGLEKD